MGKGAKIYGFATLVAGLLLLFCLSQRFTPYLLRWPEMLILVALTAILGQVFLDFQTGLTHIEFMLSDIGLISAILLFDPLMATLIFTAGFLIGECFRSHLHRTMDLFIIHLPINAGIRMLQCGIAALGYQAMKGDGPLLGSLQSAIAVLFTLFLNIMIEFLLTSGYSATVHSLSLKEAIRLAHGGLRPFTIVLAPLGVLFAVLWLKNPVSLVLLAIPIIGMDYALRNYRDTLEQAIEIIHGFCRYLDDRDHYTYGHSSRVARFAAATARKMDLGEAEVRRVKSAGMIHDLGKVMMPDRVLRKPGALTLEERSRMQTHTSAPIEMIRGFRMLRSILPVDVAFAHHEKYDGTGYPLGLKGEEIDIGARVLAVGDVFDALTSDRPYRKGMPLEAALEKIKEGSGTHFDPQVVEAFARAFDDGEIGRIIEEDKKGEEETPSLS